MHDLDRIADSNSWLAEDMKNTQYNFVVLIRFMPPIKIHVWGGLGSQLHGVALLYELLNRFPTRTAMIVLHTSGVTIRKSEIDELLPAQYLTYLSDFSVERNNEEVGQNGGSLHRFKIKIFFIKLGKLILELSGFLARANSDKNFSKLKPWVMSIRGHYTDRSIAPWAILEILSQAKSKGLIKFCAERRVDSGLHYRLGDLLRLEAKSPTESTKVASAVSSAHERFNFGKVSIFSDSGEQAKEILKDACPEIDFEICEGNTWEVISSLVAARVFIGTSSKVSEWIAVFRVTIDLDSQMVLPSHFQKLLQRYVLMPRDAPNVLLY
jgi:hypothetical protein